MNPDNQTDPVEAPVERQVFVLNEKSYFADSIGDDGKKLINSISTIQQEIQKYQLQTEIAGIAKDSLITKLEALTVTFEEVPAPVEAPEALEVAPTK